MKFITRTLLAVACLLTLTARAGEFGGARALEASIENRTGGIKVLSDSVQEERYADPVAVENLRFVLKRVLATPDLDKKTPKEIGEMTVADVGLATQYKPAERMTAVLVNMDAAKKSFCYLASAECDLFSKQISAEICPTN